MAVAVPVVEQGQQAVSLAVTVEEMGEMGDPEGREIAFARDQHQTDLLARQEMVLGEEQVVVGVLAIVRHFVYQQDVMPAQQMPVLMAHWVLTVPMAPMGFPVSRVLEIIISMEMGRKALMEYMVPVVVVAAAAGRKGALSHACGGITTARVLVAAAAEKEAREVLVHLAVPVEEVRSGSTCSITAAIPK
jgi:hypothetical protein